MPCKSPNIKTKSKCIFISTDKKTYQEAADDCKAKSMLLVSLPNQVLFDEVVVEVDKKNGKKNYSKLTHSFGSGSADSLFDIFNYYRYI